MSGNAIQLIGANFDEIEEFVGGDAEWRDGRLIVATTEGPMSVWPGNWVVRNANGTFYSCDDKPQLEEALR